MYCGNACRQTFQECFESITFQYSNCCIFNTCTNDVKYSEVDRNYKWLLLVTENL